MDHLVTANESYQSLLAERCPPTTLTFASNAVATLRKALADCVLLRNRPQATKPQGWFSMDYLCLIPEGGCCFGIRPQHSTKSEKCRFDWRSIQRGLRAQLQALEFHLSQVTEPQGTSHPDLRWLIKALEREMPLEPPRK